MPQLNALTSLRAVLAWWVVLYHLIGNDFAYIDPGWAQPIKNKGYLAVDAFFILSGFIICYVYSAKARRFSAAEFVNFLILRLVRLYPVHIVVLFIFLGMVIGSSLLLDYVPKDPERYSLYNLFLNVFLLHAWNLTDRLSWNYPSWSISCEWFAYLLFPLFNLLIVARRSAAWQAAAVAICIAGLIYLETANVWGTLNYYVNGAVWRVSVEFGLGCAVYGLWRKSQANAGAEWLGAFAFAAILVSLFYPWDTLTVALFGGLIFALAREGDWLGRRLDKRPLVYAGEISFSVYMLHAAVQTMCIQLARRVDAFGSLPQMVQLAIAAVAIFAGAAVLYRYVECPPRAYVKSWIANRSAMATMNARS